MVKLLLDPKMNSIQYQVFNETLDHHNGQRADSAEGPATIQVLIQYNEHRAQLGNSDEPKQATLLKFVVRERKISVRYHLQYLILNMITSSLCTSRSRHS